MYIKSVIRPRILPNTKETIIVFKGNPLNKIAKPPIKVGAEFFVNLNLIKNIINPVKSPVTAALYKRLSLKPPKYIIVKPISIPAILLTNNGRKAPAFRHGDG